MIVHTFSKNYSPPQEYIPIAYAKFLIDILEERDIKISDVCKDIGINYNDLTNPTGRVLFQKFASLIELVTTVTDDKSVGIRMGLHQPMTIHGNVGFAILCSATFGEGLSILRRFWHLRNQAIGFRYSEELDWAVFEFYPIVLMSNDVKRVLGDAIMAMFHSGVTFAFGQNDIGQEMWFDYATPSLPDYLIKKLPSLHYDKEALQYRIPKALLSFPSSTASPEGLEIALKLCERELEIQNETNNNLVERTKAAMILGVNGYPSFSQLAVIFDLSERTFRRQLEEHNSSYQRIKDEARHRDGIHFLENTTLDIQQIAGLIGYADPANFTRAFKGWMGVTPKMYRERLSKSKIEQS